MYKCPFCDAEMEEKPLGSCPECGRSQTVTALFLNLTRQEENHYFKSAKGVRLLNVLLIVFILGISGTLLTLLCRSLFF